MIDPEELLKTFENVDRKLCLTLKNVFYCEYNQSMI